MNRRQVLKGGLIAGAGLVAGPMLNLGRVRLHGLQPVEVSTAAADLVLGTDVIDMLGLLTLDWPKLFRWHRDPDAFQEADFRHLEMWGTNVVHPAVETSARDPYSAAMRWMSGWNNLLSKRTCFLSRIERPRDLERDTLQGRIGVVMGFQNANHFRTVEDVQAFYALGQRVSQLTYNERNRLGSGCHRRDRGLTPFGAEIVAEMDRVGMAVDVSHCGERTSLEAIAASRRPVLVTHANCLALVPGQPRCKSDRVIRRMAATGGVMGITMIKSFVGSSRPDLNDLLDHFDHVARLVGVEHVGLGSDVDPTALDPETGRARPFYEIRGLDPLARVFQIADGLLQRGYTRSQVQLVLGGNFRRALAGIWHAGPPETGPNLLSQRDPFCPAPRTGVPPTVATSTTQAGG